MNLPEFLTQDSKGFIHVAGHRIGLQHLVHYYNEGYSAELLSAEYTTLSLAVIHKIIAFYLENRSAVDQYMASCDAELQQCREAARHGPSVVELRQRLATRAAESV